MNGCRQTFISAMRYAKGQNSLFSRCCAIQYKYKPSLPALQLYRFSTQAAISSSQDRLPQNHHDRNRNDHVDGPRGSLFGSTQLQPPQPSQPTGSRLQVGQIGYVERTFSPQSNVHATLACGGPALAAHASFDPNYERASTWIQNHAVGTAVLSPILISGLVGALTEAAFPQAIVVQHSLNFTDKPLIVGVTVSARIKVVSIERQNQRPNPISHHALATDAQSSSPSSSPSPRQVGFLVKLESTVHRVQDGAAIALGEQTIWIPDYKNM